MSSNLKAQMTMTLRDKFSRNGRRLRDSMRGIRKDSREMGKGFKSAARDAAEMARKDIQAARSKQDLISQFKKGQSAVKQSRLEYVAAKAKMQALSKEIKAAEKPSKKLQAAFKKARQDTDRLGRAFKQTTQSAQKHKSAMSEAGIKVNRLAETERKLSSRIDSATREMNEQTQAVRRQAAEYQKLERRKQAVLRLTNRERQRRDSRMVRGAAVGAAGVGGMLAGRQLARPVTSAVVQFAGFEEQMDSVAAVTRIDQSSSQYKDLSNLARKLGATTSYSAIEAAQGMNFLAMAGMGPEAIQTAMADVLNLAKATKTDLAGTADISSNILSGFGLDPADMTRVADVLTATTTRANVDLTMLGESMKYAAPVAKQLGVSLEETAAMAGLLGNVGIQGSMAGTALRTIYTRLAAPAKRGKKALRELSVETRDAAGNLRSVPDVLLDIAKATQKMGSGKRAQIFKDIAGAEAGSAFAALLDAKGYAVFETLLADLQDVNGEAKRVATQMGDNLMGDWLGFKSSVSEVALIFGGALNPILRDTVQSMTRMARGMGEWLKEHPNVTKAIGFTVAALAGFLIVGGGLLAFMGTAIALAAPMRFGLFMMGLSARTGAGRIGLIGRAIRMLNPIRWAMLIPKLAWRLFVTPLKWLSFITRFGWRMFVGGLRWASFIPKIGWRGLLTGFRWLSFLPKLSWRLLIPVLKWTARLIPGIGWAVTLGLLAWDLIIKPLGWDKYLPSIEWSEVFGAFSWDGWMPKVDWGMLFGAVKWPDELTGFDWKSFISDIDWVNILLFGLPGAVNEVVKAFTGIDLFEMGASAIKSLWNGMSSMVGQMVADIKASMTGMLPDWATEYLGIGGGADKSGGKVQARASGGSYRSGPLLVGERGPELKYSSQSGYIAHNDNLKRMVRMSDRIRRVARIGAVAGAIAAPMPSVAAAQVLPEMSAQAGPAAAAGSGITVSVQIGNITANDNDIEARIQQAIQQGVQQGIEAAMGGSMSRLSD
ncbi:phage tail tape measure protein [Pseudovibrio sp. Tun.PSC04-5.I4]|uniref:phage tail tape measure protein n=1 Tax=Pseudovibrio sp. Tun.PSC04-5.I4 TaxID=1798213 RepID=UPI00087EF30B|nr:phage tail tape measure protein [Pseudovibrio sp. Tun.PSC04-5.I4]SDR07411.1 phage tail tape measure protein, TP901 family, core region [Pseudovibrio sp. Tun.PSC04-5.I4]